MNNRVEIVGAGPSGLTAAITLANNGKHPVVYERHDRVGHRFHGDFQGLENWSSEQDVLDELRDFGIEPSFEHVPFYECVFWGPDGQRFEFESDVPLWYLVRRGSGEGTLDHALLEQAQEAGVEIRFGNKKEHLSDGGIVAHGPKRADAIAAGYTFDTDDDDGAYSILSDDLAPSGYAYLLIAGGRGTIATCMFDDFHNEQDYLERSVEAFKNKVDFTMNAPESFGGTGNVFMDPRIRKSDLLYVGEGAGFQDALFGFGIRYAIRSGYFAGEAFVEGDLAQYETRCRNELIPHQRRSVVNRYLYDKFRSIGYRYLLRSLDRSRNPRRWMKQYYDSHWLKNSLYPWARKAFERNRELIPGCRENCHCTYCRCERHWG